MRIQLNNKHLSKKIKQLSLVLKENQDDTATYLIGLGWKHHLELTSKLEEGSK